jgi:hypothetical protein
MAAGLGFKTFTTGDVLTADDVNGYLMQGVLVFASAAARTSAITSPQEGQLSFLKDTNSTEYYSGSAWVAVAGTTSSPGVVFIQSATASAATTLTMDSVFTSTYKNYLLVGSFDGSTDATVRIRFRTSGSDNATANYNYAVFYNPNSGSLSGAGGATGDDNGKFANHGSSGTCYFSATILNPQVSEQTGWLSNGYRFSSARTDHFGNFSATTAFDGFKLYPDAGTFTGTVRLYGLANS